MKYNEYMDLFTVSPEVKSSVFNIIKQHKKQTHRTENKTKIVTSAPKKNNTVKLHPKRWIAIATSIVLVAVLTPIIYFSVPRGNFEDNSLSLDYMKNLMVNVEGITAYSIRKETKNTANTASAKTAKAASVSLLSAKVIDDNGKDNDNNSGGTKHNHYLYSTSEDYEYGNVEYDSKGIQRVTFIKNTEVIEDVYDKNGDLIDSNRTITQDELDAQINKMYTTKLYTYIQFVPLVESSGEYPYKDSNGKIQYEYVDLRPDSLVYDEYGVSEFDTTGYFSSNLTASFVIDNSTGYIYKIENLYIKEFVNGLVKDDVGNYYSITTDTANNLLLTDIMPNKDIVIKNALIDNYGWLFVANDSVNEVDNDKKIIYTTKTNKYLVDFDRNVYVWDMDYESYNGLSILPYLPQKMIDGEAVEFENDGIIWGLQGLFSNQILDISQKLIGMYYDLTVYNPNIFNAAIEGVFCTRAAYNNANNGPAYNGDIGSGLYVVSEVVGSIEYRWLDNLFDTLIASKEGRLYYTSTNLNDCRNKAVLLYFDKDFVQLSDVPLRLVEEDYYMNVGNDRYKINDVYYYTGTNKTTYYRLLKSTTGVELVEITSKSYTDNVFIFQPINK